MSQATTRMRRERERAAERKLRRRQSRELVLRLMRHLMPDTAAAVANAYAVNHADVLQPIEGVRWQAREVWFPVDMHTMASVERCAGSTRVRVQHFAKPLPEPIYTDTPAWLRGPSPR